VKSRLQLAAACTILPCVWGQTPGGDLADLLRKKIEANPSSTQNHFPTWVDSHGPEPVEGSSERICAALHGDGQLAAVLGWSRIYLVNISEAAGRHDQAVAEYFEAVCTEVAGSTAAGWLKKAGFSERDFDVRCGRATSPAAVEKTEPDYTDEARLAELAA